ncbi:SlyX family protein [Kingella oralis]|jgi:protein slyX homolog
MTKRVNPMNENELENRIIELEIRLALQDELVGSLNDTVAKMQDALDLQQAQLRLLYNKIQQQSDDERNQPYSLADEVPPHY